MMSTSKLDALVIPNTVRNLLFHPGGSLFALFLALSLCAPASCAPGRLVVVIAGNLNIRDLIDPSLPQFSDMIENGSSALMNVRTGRLPKDAVPAPTPGMEAACVSLGAGAMAVGGAEVRSATASGEIVDGSPARNLYACRTGTDPGPAEMLLPEIALMRRINEAASYHAVPGALGSALRQAGIKMAFIGSSDIPDEKHREAAAIAMDESGIIDRGSKPPIVASDCEAAEAAACAFLEELTETDPSAPYGIRANTRALLVDLDRALRDCRFVVIDFGDTFRADLCAQVSTERQAPIVKRRSLERLAEFVAQVAGKMDFKRDLLIMLSPTPSLAGALDGERLTPVVVRGPGFEGGVLTSPSTRRDGLITLSDVAPTILDFFHIKPPVEMTGRPAVSVPGIHAADYLPDMNSAAGRQAQRQPAMRGGSVAQSAVVALVTLALLLGVGSPLRNALMWVALIPIVMPLAMLYLPAFYSGGLAGAVACLIALTAAVIGLCAWALRRADLALVWLCAAIVISVIVDLLRGAPLISSSIAGYGVVEGARYYGIGNELMGTTLGATLIGVGMILAGERIPQRLRGTLAAVIFAGVLVCIGAPGLGAKVGGVMAAAPAMAVAMLARRGWRPNARGIALIAAFAAAVLAALFAYDALHGGASQSHAGRVAQLAAGGKIVDILLVFQRKITLNLMLLSTSLWRWLLALSLIASAALFHHARRKDHKACLSKEEAAGMVGALVAVVGAFVFNDSGVVAAATCSVFPWALMALRQGPT